MDWKKVLSLIQALVPVAVSVAETVHPLSGSGKAKLTTAVTLVQTGLGVAAAAGAIPPEAALQIAPIVEAVNTHVEELNKTGAGVKTL
jgi:hypothetical protein